MAEFPHRTALELSVEEWKDYDPLTAIRLQRSAMQSKLSQRRRRAVRIAQRAAALLRTDFNAQRVILFGSLAKRGGFTLWSDIDLATRGIPVDRFYAAVAAVTGMSAEFKINLVDLESCGESLRKTIEREGNDL